jgi:hypothetical protein
MGQRQKGSQQHLLLVFYDLGFEYDVFALRPSLSFVLWIPFVAFISGGQLCN